MHEVVDVIAVRQSAGIGNDDGEQLRVRMSSDILVGVVQ